jgi:tetrahydromethanopterin S-methyltransferase subunit C
MNDLEPYGSTTSLSKKGVTAIGGIIGGVVLLVLGGLGTVVGLITGAVVGVIGLSELKSNNPADKRTGTFIAAAGALTMVSKIPVLELLAKPLLLVGAVGLLGIGIWNGIKFLQGLKARS